MACGHFLKLVLMACDLLGPFFSDSSLLFFSSLFCCLLCLSLLFRSLNIKKRNFNDRKDIPPYSDIYFILLSFLYLSLLSFFNYWRIRFHDRKDIPLHCYTIYILFYWFYYWSFLPCSIKFFFLLSFPYVLETIITPFFSLSFTN